MRAIAIVGILAAAAAAHPPHLHTGSESPDAFAQLDTVLRDPNDVRTASGAPGPGYWQQRVDYVIDVRLDADRRRIEGVVTMTYHNRSPHSLPYVWIQLDQNRFRNTSENYTASPAAVGGGDAELRVIRGLLARERFDGGYDIRSVTDGDGRDLPLRINQTMMRVDPPSPIGPGESLTVRVAYAFNLVDASVIRARGGYEPFDDGSDIFTVAQFFPRACAYTDYRGWQNDQFIGAGEFTLEFGSYDVRIDVPADMVVAATGELTNAPEVMSDERRRRLSRAIAADEPVFVVTPGEAEQTLESDPSNERRTWVYHADDVRDFAFAASRRFAWDAMGVDVGGRRVAAMSLYPPVAEPLWRRYSTEAVAHTIEVYGEHALEYPYDAAISVNGPVFGMEYPMICFNGPRPEDDGTYSAETKAALISVVIHEVGHNWFPMIVNSDERRHTWMDEGLNTFLQYVAERRWDAEYPSRRGDPEKIAAYMVSHPRRPVMTGSEEVLQFGNNAYAKPAAALNILRETILGRDAFDDALRTYCRRWKFKRPTPADLFRTFEDATATDLDWFWRGWFYGNDPVDIAVTDLRRLTIDDGDPDAAAARRRKEREDEVPNLTRRRNRDGNLPRRTGMRTGLLDFYDNDHDEFAVDASDREKFREMIDGLSDDERRVLADESHFYVATFENVGGTVMPVPVRLTFDDGSTRDETIPARIWRRDARRVEKLWITDRVITSIEIDRSREIADSNRGNNRFPPRIEADRFRVKPEEDDPNPMRKAKEAKEAKAAEAASEGG